VSRSPSMHIRFPEKLWAQLRVYMEQTGQSKQESVRALLQLGLNEHQKSKGD
jgi:hypothetical protein